MQIYKVLSHEQNTIGAKSIAYQRQENTLHLSPTFFGIINKTKNYLASKEKKNLYKKTKLNTFTFHFYH